MPAVVAEMGYSVPSDAGAAVHVVDSLYQVA
jgi:hypothetical protein